MITRSMKKRKLPNKKGGQEEEKQNYSGIEIKNIKLQTCDISTTPSKRRTTISSKHSSLTEIPLTPSAPPPPPAYSPPRTNFSGLTFPSTMPKQIITNYIPIRELGKGSFGEVWEAIPKNTQEEKKKNSIPQHVAIKVGLEQKYDPKIGIDAQTLNELSIMSRLKHPNIIELKEISIGNLDSNKKEEVPLYFAFVLELADRDLRTHLDSLWGQIYSNTNPVSETKKERYFQQQLEMVYWIFCGINYLHVNGIWHLDLKPENILVKNNILKIADFGLSDRKEAAKVPGFKKITYAYRPSEMQCGSTNYNEKADIWSIGVILMEIFFDLYLGYINVPQTNKESVKEEHNLFKTMKARIGLPSAEWMAKYVCAPSLCSINPSKEYIEDTTFQYKNMEQTVLRKKSPKFNFIKNELYGPQIYNWIWDLISKCLRFNPEERITFEEVLKHPLFTENGFCPTCTNCKIVNPYDIKVEYKKDFKFRKELDPLFQELVNQNINVNPLLVYASTIYNRYLSVKKLKKEPFNEIGAQSACLVIASKLLNSEILIRIRDFIIKNTPLTQRELNSLEIEIGNSLGWNFDGPL